MKLQGFRPNLSRNIMIQLLVASISVIFLLIAFADIIELIYFSNQQTNAGLALNGLILVLFLAGMSRVIALLLRYRSEEQAVGIFRANLDERMANLLTGVDPGSLIGSRYLTLERMRDQHAEINHHALASTLLASESTRTGATRFVHNVLILCGVLGTIISLSIALFGASSLLEAAVSSSGMGMVIHGMSTALSTTMTAIICYLFFGYFHGAVQDAQTNILSAVEHLTTTRLLPLFRVTPETINQELVDILKHVSQLVNAMSREKSDMDFGRLLAAVTEATDESRSRHQQMMARLDALQETLRAGFRLPEA